MKINKSTLLMDRCFSDRTHTDVHPQHSRIITRANKDRFTSAKICLLISYGPSIIGWNSPIRREGGVTSGVLPPGFHWGGGIRRGLSLFLYICKLLNGQGASRQHARIWNIVSGFYRTDKTHCCALQMASFALLFTSTLNKGNSFSLQPGFP